MERAVSAARRPNILVVMADQWRPQAMGCAGADPVATPCMDAFAREGTLLERAYCCSPICTPSRASILSGKHPFSLGMMHNWLQFPAGEATAAKAFAAAGYRTGWIGKWHLDAFLPGDQENIWNIFTPPGERRLGFQYWYAHGCNHNHFTRKYMDTGGNLHVSPGWQIGYETDVAIRYLERAAAREEGDAPFLLFLSWSPPHTNHGGDPRFVPDGGPQYHAPEEFERPYRRADLPVRGNADAALYREAAPGYFGAVASMDREYGRLLGAVERLGLAEDTIVALTADHGEMLGSHGLMTKDVWFEESIGIPFLIRWPGRIPAGERRRFLFSTVDFFPTFAGLAGVDIPGGLHGRDRSACMRGAAAGHGDGLFLAHEAGSPFGKVAPDVTGYPHEPGRRWRGVRTDRFTYAVVNHGPDSIYHAPGYGAALPAGVREVLYDNEADPLQQRPIFEGQGHDAVLAEMRGRVRGWLDSLGDPFFREEW